MRNRKAVMNLWSGILVMLVVFQAGMLMASNKTEEGSKEEARAEAGTSSEAVPASANSATVASVASMMDEMREQISAQRKQIEKLQSALEKQQVELEKAMRTIAASNTMVRTSVETPAIPASRDQGAQASAQKIDDVELVKGELEAVAGSAAEANQRLTKLESDTAAHKKETDGKGRQLGNFTFSGDIRLRVEPFFQEGADTRTRERFRLRFNVVGKVSDEISGGFSLATGTLDDPVSTNQSLTSFFNRKNIGIDKAYLTYQPKYAKPLRLDGGRFAYPWYRTPMTFDNDVNVEGVAETLSFDLKSPVFRNFTVVGFQLPFNEIHSNNSLDNNADSYILGGQVQFQFQLGSKTRLGLYGAGLDFLRTDPIAVAVAGNTLRPSLPNSNTYRYTGTTVVGYATKFAYLDAIVKLDIDTSARFPTSLVLNFVNNVRGSSERSGYMGELLVGKTRAANDMQFGYAFFRIEKDAVIGAWNESDLRSSTNVLNHRFSYAYMIKSNVTGQFTAWVGRLASPWMNTNLVPIGVRGACTGADLPNCEDPYLKRLQFDVIYKF
jgi:hypothetical protein